MAEFRERRLDHIEFAYVFVDATDGKAHEGARVVSKAVIVATEVAADGNREVLGLAVGDSEDKAFWSAFLRSLRARGLTGGAPGHLRCPRRAAVLHRAGHVGSGLAAMSGALPPQRAGQGPEGLGRVVAAALRAVFAQPDAAAVADQLDSIAGKLGPQLPAVEAMLREAAVDICALAAFPAAHWKMIWSTNPLERVNKAIKRRTNVVGIFPKRPGCCASPGSILLEVHDE